MSNNIPVTPGNPWIFHRSCFKVLTYCRNSEMTTPQMKKYPAMEKNSVVPRKLPFLDRSKKRIGRIPDATIRLLEKSGLKGITAINVSQEAQIAVAYYKSF